MLLYTNESAHLHTQHTQNTQQLIRLHVNIFFEIVMGNEMVLHFNQLYITMISAKNSHKITRIDRDDSIYVAFFTYSHMYDIIGRRYESEMSTAYTDLL